MIESNLSQQYRKAAIAFGIAAAIIYLLMIGTTLPQMEDMSGGVPFDMQPFGYGVSAAVELLNALGEDGRNYYLTRQIPLDMMYPALLAVTLASMMKWFGLSGVNTGLVRISIALSVCAALFDYAENLGVSIMILKWPNLPHMLVQASSLATISKSCLTVAALVIILVLARSGCTSENRDPKQTVSRNRIIVMHFTMEKHSQFGKAAQRAG